MWEVRGPAKFVMSEIDFGFGFDGAAGEFLGLRLVKPDDVRRRAVGGTITPVQTTSPTNLGLQLLFQQQSNVGDMPNLITEACSLMPPVLWGLPRQSSTRSSQHSPVSSPFIYHA